MYHCQNHVEAFSVQYTYVLFNDLCCIFFVERFWVLLPDCLMVLFAEVLVDWIKHAFITRFNELPVDVYRDYTISLAYDMAQTRQKHVSMPLFFFIDPAMVVVQCSIWFLAIGISQW